jgi:small subunit ribosomal protein S14
MTTSDYRKAFGQLKAKPIKLKKYVKHNAPKERSCGRARIKCRRCGQTGTGGHLAQYKLDLCRQCFREIALNIGFKKFD